MAKKKIVVCQRNMYAMHAAIRSGAGEHRDIKKYENKYFCRLDKSSKEDF